MQVCSNYWNSRTAKWYLSSVIGLLAAGAWLCLGQEVGSNSRRLEAAAAKPARDSDQQNRDTQQRQPSDQQKRPGRFLLDPLDELDDLFKDPPPGVDPQQWEALRQMLRRQREEMRQMLERLQRGQLNGDRGLLPIRPILPRPGRLGVTVEPLHPALRDQLGVPEDQGLLVREVLPDSPAAKAGVKQHDILLQIGDKTVPAEPTTFVRMISELPAGKVGKVVVLRKGKKESLGELELPELPRRPRLPELRFPPGQIPPGGIWLHVERSADGSFAIQYREANQAIRIEGHETEGKANVSKIEITDDGQTKTYKSLEEVPASLRDKVSKLLDSALKGRFFVPERQPRQFD